MYKWCSSGVLARWVRNKVVEMGVGKAMEWQMDLRDIDEAVEMSASPSWEREGLGQGKVRFRLDKVVLAFIGVEIKNS